jgi:hypothetical protein
MRNALVLLAFLPAATLVAAPTRPEAGLVNTIDRTFQSRFEKIDGMMLGLSRIPTTPEHRELILFTPENDEDKRLTTTLKESGWEAAFFVAGRNALHQAATLALLRKKNPNDPRLSQGEVVDSFVHRRSVSKPVRMTKPVAGTAALPSQIALIPRVSDAFQAFAAKKASYEFEDAGWKFTARPIPASKTACLKCHKTDESGKALKVGDPLGVAFYAFARAGEGKAPQQFAAPVEPKPRQQTGSLR